MSIMGTRVVRTEDPLFLSRGATYTDDLTDERLAGALHLTLVRSPLAHARVTSVDVSEAAEAPGVVAVLNQDRADVEAVGVRQTPTFFVNAKPLDPFGEAELRRLVAAEVAASQS